MSFERPTLPALVTRIQVDFVSRLELVGAVLRRSVLYVLARVLAGAAHMLHGHLEYLGRQLFPDQSDDAYLVRQASLFSITKVSPSYATGQVTFTGVDGSVIPAGVVLARSDGEEYTTDAEVTIASGEAVADVTATVAGAAGSLVDGLVLAFESPVAGVDATAEVTDVTADGADQESTESLRARVLERLADPPHGGTVADYVAWSKEVAGVTRVWVSPLELGPGTVVVRFARDEDPSPIPDAGEVAVLQAYLDEKAPAHAAVTAFAPVDLPVNFTIEITPDTSTVRAAVAAELEDLILRQGEPGGTILLSAIQTTIGTSAGVTDYVLTVPAANVTATANQLPSLGSITWV